MKKFFTVFVSMIVILSLITISCNTEVKENAEPVKIENTLQSVSYMKDTVGYNPQLLLEDFAKMNKAIDEIGYPDAGYKTWLNQSDESDVRFMIVGCWPDQAAYDIIHDHQLFINARTSLDSILWNDLQSVEYHRFGIIK